MCLEKESQVFLGGRAGRKETVRRDRKGLPRRSSGLTSALALQGGRVRSLTGELRSCMPHGRAKKQGKKERQKASRDGRFDT